MDILPLEREHIRPRQECFTNLWTTLHTFLQAGRHSGLFDVHNLFWALFWCTCIQSRGRLSQIPYPFNIATRNKHITFLWDLEMHTCIIWCSLLSDTVPSKLSGECGLLKPCLRCCTTLRCLYFQLYCARTSFWFIFFLSIFYNYFLKRVENRVLDLFDNLFSVVKYTSQFWFFFYFFFSNRYFMGLLDCCWPRIGERIQMAAVHYLCWCIYFCYIEYQTYLRVFRNFKCSHRKLSDYVYINVNRQLNILTHLFLM